MDDLTNGRSFDSQATWVIDVLWLFVDRLSRCVCTNRHWQTSARLVQELNGCAVEHGIRHRVIFRINKCLSNLHRLRKEVIYTKRKTS